MAVGKKHTAGTQGHRVKPGDNFFRLRPRIDKGAEAGTLPSRALAVDNYPAVGTIISQDKLFNAVYFHNGGMLACIFTIF
jgi:hypothetical protein